MSNHYINYKFIFSDKNTVQYQVDLDEVTTQPAVDKANFKPDWALLEFSRCSNCPLNVKDNEYCPVALKLAPLVELCGSVSSYEMVDVEVFTPQRAYMINATSTQRAFSSLLGLVIATSACPHTAFFRSMARFHLPLADDEETLYRAVSSYLLLQYFMRKQGKVADYDLQGLDQIYKNMQIINAAMAARLRKASSNDAAVNAVVLLDMFARGIPYSIDDALAELQYLYFDIV